MATPSSWLLGLGGVAVAAALLLGESVNGQGLTPEEFEKVKSLKDAVEVVKERLKQDGKREYAALLTEARVRDAIHTAVRSYEALQEKAEKQNPGTMDHFQKEVKPVCLKIVDTGEWPQGCSFFSFYTLTDRRDGRDIAYDGLGLRLQIETPQAKFKAFALPILDLYFGKFAGPGE